MTRLTRASDVSGTGKANGKGLRRGAQALLSARGFDLTQPQVADVCEAVFDALRDELLAGRSVGIQGFGAFHIRVRQAREIHNPRLGTVVMPRQRVILFRPANHIRDTLKET